jgi:hypothetical protein
MRAPYLAIGVAAAAMAAMVTRPAMREAILDGIDPSRPAEVAQVVCRAEADVVGGEPFIPCMRRLVPGLPFSWADQMTQSN